MVTYLRLRLAVGNRSLELDPSDRPFRPLRLTDSLLGYMLLAFLFAVSLHLLLAAEFFRDETHWPLLLGIDGAAFFLALLAEQLTLVLAVRKEPPRTMVFPPTPAPSPTPSPSPTRGGGEQAPTPGPSPTVGGGEEAGIAPPSPPGGRGGPGG
jgi:hypothetical protein